MELRRRRLIPLASSLSAAVALLGTTTRVLAQQSEDRGTDPPPPAPPSWVQSVTGPALTCGMQPMVSGGAITAATLTCWVAGAPYSDSTFSAQALRAVDEFGTTTPIGPNFATGTLENGTGVCSGEVQDTAAPLSFGVMVQVTLQPSETVLGPVRILPTPSGA